MNTEHLLFKLSIILKLILLFKINTVNCESTTTISNNNVFNLSLVEFSKSSYFVNGVKWILDETNFMQYFDWRQTKCNSQITYIISQQIILNDTKTLPILDAWGKFPSGVLEGQLFDLGSFDECMKINITTEAGNIKGQYCLIGSNNLPNFKMGICVPDSCRPQYINDLLNYVLNNSKNSTVNLILDCQTNDRKSFDILDFVMLSVFCVILFLMVISTLYDVLNAYFGGRQVPILVIFSIYTNGKKLFSSSPNSSDVMNCLNGIRVLSLLWVIIGHVYALKLLEFTINLSVLTSWLTHYYSMLILTATVSVDSFFVLSGLLVTMKVFKELEQCNGKVNIMALYLHRYIRIAPANAAIILFALSLYRYFGNGPVSNLVQQIGVTESCEKYWWSALLYVQNYVNPSQTCLLHTWYLSIDMQLFLLSPFILIPLWKYGRNVLFTILTLILFSIVFTFYISYTNRYTWSLLKNGGLLNSNQLNELYFPTHLRMGPWLVGVILGYLLYNKKTNYVKLSKWFLTLGWIISFLIIFIVIFGPYNLQQLSYKEHPLESPFYLSLHKVAWSIGLGWIIFVCVTGYGSFINKFLSWNIWTILSRLSYSMYLLHMLIQFLRIKSIQTGSYFSDFNAIHTFWGDFGLTLTASVFWTLAFESPILALEKIIRGL